MASVFRSRRKPGWWVAQYRDPETRRKRQRQFRTKAEAVAHTDRVRQHAAGLDGLVPDRRFDQHAGEWLRATSTVLRDGTLQQYRSIIKVHLLPAFGRRTLRQITTQDVRDLVVKLRESGLTKVSARNVRAILAACLAPAVEDGVLRANPAVFPSRSKLMRMGADERKPPKAMDPAQARAFLAVLRGQWGLVLKVMLLSGLRPGEAIGLEPGDVDYQAHRLGITRSITPSGKVEPTKTGKAGQVEYVDIPPRLAAELHAHETALAQQAITTGRPRPRWLFPDASGGPPGRKALHAALHAFLKAAKLPQHFTPHCLRHTYATLQLIAGESVYYVSRQLRHADIKMTVGTYGSWLPAGDRAAAERLEGWLTDSAPLARPAVTSPKRPISREVTARK